MAGVMTVEECPMSWDEIEMGYQRAIANRRQLALAYPPPKQLPPQEIWEQLVGIAKYLSRTGETATKEQFYGKLGLSDLEEVPYGGRTFNLGLEALAKLGMKHEYTNGSYQFSWSGDIDSEVDHSINSFLEAVKEEQFQRQYFYQVPLSTL